MSRAMMNWSKVPEIKTRQDHCEGHLGVTDHSSVCVRQRRGVVGVDSYVERVFGEQEHQED